MSNVVLHVIVAVSPAVTVVLERLTDGDGTGENYDNYDQHI